MFRTRSLLIAGVTALFGVSHLAGIADQALAEPVAQEAKRAAESEPSATRGGQAESLSIPPNATRGKISAEELSSPSLKAGVLLVAPGWLRAYASQTLPPGLRLAVPEYYETVLETDMRASIEQALDARGIETVVDPGRAPYRLSYSATMQQAGKNGLPQSRLRLESDALARHDQSGDARLPAPGNAVRPGLALGPRGKHAQSGPSLRVSIMVLRGDERVWSGFAQAELGPHKRSDVARLLVSALMRHWGENAEMDDATFTTGGGVIAPQSAADAKF